MKLHVVTIEKANTSTCKSIFIFLKLAYGVYFMSDPAQAGKAVQAFMAMRKLNIEKIVKASIS